MALSESAVSDLLDEGCSPNELGTSFATDVRRVVGLLEMNLLVIESAADAAPSPMATACVNGLRALGA